VYLAPLGGMMKRKAQAVENESFQICSVVLFLNLFAGICSFARGTRQEINLNLRSPSAFPSGL